MVNNIIMRGLVPLAQDGGGDGPAFAIAYEMIKGNVFRQALVAILSYGLAVPYSAHAEVEKPIAAAPPRGQAEAYAMCVDMLKLEASGALEKTLVQQVTSQGQALQLLFDYKIILSSVFTEAVRFVLTEHKLVFLGLDNKTIATPAELEKLSAYLTDMAGWPEQRLRPLVIEILLRMRQLATFDRTFALKTSRIVNAITELPPGNFFEQAMSTVLQQSFLQTSLSAKKIRITNATAGPGSGIAPFVWIGAGFFGFLSVAGLIANELGAAYNPCDFCQTKQTAFSNFGTNTLVIGAVSVIIALLASVGTSGYQNPEADAKARKKSQIQQVVNGFKNHLFNFFLKDAKSGMSVSATAPDLLNLSVNPPDTGVVTLKEICSANDVCSLSILDIAYLGYSDRLVLLGLSDDLSHTLELSPELGELQKLLIATQNVKTEPRNIALRFDFLSQVKASLSVLRAFKTDFDTKVQTLTEAVLAVKSSVRTIAALPFKNSQPEATDRNRILFEKVQIDLHELSNIELSTAEMTEQTQRLTKLIAQLVRFEETVPTSQAEWSDFVTQAQSDLQRLQVTIGNPK